MADVGVIDGRIAFVGDLSQASRRRNRGRKGTDGPARRHRHPGPLPRAGAGVEGGPRERQSRAAALGGVVGRVRDAEHRAQHDRSGHACGQAGPRAGPDVDRPCLLHRRHARQRRTYLAELERLPGCCGVKVFMGASTGEPAGRRRRRGARGAERHVEAAAPPSIPRTSTASSTAARWPGPATGPAIPEVRDAESAIMSDPPPGPALAREDGARIHVLHVSTAEEVALPRRPQGRGHGRGHATAPDPRR
jgi:dihydroorotase